MKKLNIVLCVIAAVIMFPFQGASQSWSWARDISAYASVNFSAVESDAAGNTYFFTRYDAAGNYGDIELAAPLFVPLFFLVKQSPDGSVLWTKIMDGDGAFGFLIDGFDVSAAGDVFLTGKAAAIPGTPSVSIDGVIAIGPFDFLSKFIFKINTDGIVQWGVNLKEFDGSQGGTAPAAVQPLKLESNEDGSILIVAGSHRSDSLNVGGIEVELGISGSATIDFQFYVASLNTSDGTLNWANGGNGSYEFNFVKDLSLNADGEIFVDVEWFGDTARVGDIIIPNFDNQGGGSEDNLVAKFSENGTPIWANNIGSPSEDKSFLAASEDGGVVVYGEIIEGIDVEGTTLEAPGTYALKYNFEGGVSSFEKVSNASIKSLDSDGQGNYVMAGDFTDEILTIGSFELENAGGGLGTSDIFFSKVSESGEVLWARRIGGMDDEEVLEIDYSESGAINVSGLFRSFELVLDDITLEIEDFPGFEGFVASMDLSLGVFDGHKAETIAVYPNPTSEFVYIDLDNVELKQSEINVVDMNGRVVIQSKQTLNSLNRLDVSHLENGIYFLSYEQNGMRYAGKFMVNK